MISSCLVPCPLFRRAIDELFETSRHAIAHVHLYTYLYSDCIKTISFFCYLFRLALSVRGSFAKPLAQCNAIHRMQCNGRQRTRQQTSILSKTTAQRRTNCHNAAGTHQEDTEKKTTHVAEVAASYEQENLKNLRQSREDTTQSKTLVQD